MHRLNVRCCCQPQKILGTLELRSLALRQEVYIPPEYPSIWSKPEAINEIVQVPPYETIVLRQFYHLATGELELAVYSDDRPIEFWRKFKGFREATSESDEINEYRIDSP